MNWLKQGQKNTPETMQIINLQITADPKEVDGKYNKFPPELENIMHDLLIEAKKGSYKTSEKLAALIEKYPYVPVLYNLLGAAYMKQGKTDNAKALMDKCFDLFPDYLFARMTKAKNYAFDEDFEKAKEMLGGMQLNGSTGLYPNRKTFHVSEVTNFYQCCALILINEGKIEAAESHLDLLDTIGEKFDKQDLTDDLRMRILAQRTKTTKGKMGKQKVQEVESTDKPWVKNSLTPPPFHHTEIQWLYENGLDISEEKIQTLLSLPRQTLIEDLKKVIDDSCARFDDFESQDWNEKTHNFMMHALWLLAELPAEEALPHALNVLRQDLGWLDYWFSDALTENLHSVFYHLGQNRLDVLKDFIKEPDNYWTARGLISNVVSLIAVYQPQRRQEVLDWYTDVLQFFIDNKDDKRVSDYILNGSLAEEILDFKGEELFPLLKKMFDANIVDQVLTGDWEDLMAEFEEFKSDPYLKNIETRAEAYADMVNWGKPIAPPVNKKIKSTPKFPKPKHQAYQQTYGYTPTSTADSLKNIKSTPRNSPCPCGSGKKYKNCHGK